MAATYEATLVAVTMQQAAAPTLVEVCGLKWTALTIVDELGAPGSCTLNVQVGTIEAAGKARLAALDLYPCELWVRRSEDGTSTIAFAGPIVACRISGDVLTISAAGLLAHLAAQLRETDYTANSVDQATIVRTLIDEQQALPYGHRGLDTTQLTATGVTRDLNLSATEGKFILPAIAEMGVRSNGFDLTVDPATREVRMWSPRKGNDLTGAVFLDRRSISSPNMSWSVAAGTIGSEVFASSSSTVADTITSLRSNATLRSTLGRTYVSRSFNDISVQATLDDHADRALIDVGSVSFTITPDLIPVTGVSYGDFSTGDLITYDFDAGLGAQTFPVRVASIELSLSGGREVIRIGVL